MRMKKPEQMTGGQAGAAIRTIHGLAGHAYGFGTACLVVEFNRADLPANLPRALEDALKAYFLSLDPAHAALLDEASPGSDVPDRLARWLWLCLRVADVPLIECGREVDSHSGEVRRVVVPAPVAAHALLSRVCWRMLALSMQPEVGHIRRLVDGELPRAVNALRRLVPDSSNIPRFLAAAMQLDIPVEEVISRTLQFGQGSKARWLDSSFTDQTPRIGAEIARNKHWAARVLFDAGFPVAPHLLVESHQQALQAAKKIGFPVVVKPADRDGGLAVAAGLMTEAEVRDAFDNAKKYSNTVMLEKHIPGRDYRLNIFAGELLWAIERVPAGVTGDGRHSVAALLDILNADPRRGGEAHSPLKKILLDDEAMGLLRSKGKSPDSVLPPGEFLPLRRRANVAAGAMPVSVMDKVHPDNVRLAVRAVTALGLDLAGVDFISPDIGLSWMEAGGAICEVNAQPQLGSVTSVHVYSDILQQMVEGNGRIPITVVLGAPDEWPAELAVAAYAAAGHCVGYAGRRGIFVGRECISRKPLSPYRAGKVLLRDRSVDAIVLEINDFSVLKTGMPFDRGYRLETFGPDTRWMGDIPHGMPAEAMQMLIDMIAPGSV